MQVKLYFAVVILSLLIIEGIFDESVIKAACPPGIKEVNCFVDPCLNKACPADPNARCISNYCGGCNAMWITSNGKRARCTKRRQSRCPSGEKEVQCFKDPCQGETCSADSSAKCISNYCGGCNFSWKRPNGKPAQCNVNNGLF